MGDRRDHAVLPGRNAGENAWSDTLRPHRAEQAAQSIAGQIDIGRHARRQPALNRFQSETDATSEQHGQHQRRETSGQTVQREGQEKTEGKINGDVRRQIEKGPVARQAAFKESKRGNAAITPAGERMQAAIHNQAEPGQCEVAGKQDGATAKLGHEPILWAIRLSVSPYIFARPIVRGSVVVRVIGRVVRFCRSPVVQGMVNILDRRQPADPLG